ncbi:D-amino acid dehydrogenase [Streptomyces griseorubiginosus]
MTRTVPGRTDHVVVVGAGLSGLAAALHLLGAGRRVTLVERDATPGGRAGLLVRDGYRIDTGPTVLTMPHLADEAFAAVGDSLRARVDLLPLHPAYRARFADGSTLDVHTDAEAMETEIERFAGAREADGYRRLRVWLEKLYRGQMRRFIDANFDSPLQLLHPDLGRLAALGGFGRLDARIGRFLGDERLRRVFSFQSLYAGVAPERALAAYAVIAYMDTIAGVYFPRGGMHALPRAMADAAADAGAELRFGETVTRLERSGDRITAVVTDRGRIACDAVVLTPDLPVTYGLLGRTPTRPVGLRFSPSAVILHAGTDRTWPALAHHTISFGAAWRQTFTELTESGRLMSDPSLLITRPTATDPSLAPPGHHLHYILAPCPNTAIGPDAADWSELAPATATACSRSWSGAAWKGSPTRSRRSAWSRRPTGRRRGTRPARPSPRPTPSRRPARSGRATWSAVRPTRSSPAAAPRPASASRPCSCRASSPPPASPAAPARAEPAPPYAKPWNGGRHDRP